VLDLALRRLRCRGCGGARPGSRLDQMAKAGGLNRHDYAATIVGSIHEHTIPKMDDGTRWGLAGLAATAAFTLLALAFPKMSRWISIPGATISFGFTLYLMWPVIVDFHFLRQHRIIPLIGIVLSLLCLVGFGSWYLWPVEIATAKTEDARPTTPAKRPPWKHTLEDLFKTDFNLLSAQRELQSTFRDSDPPIVLKSIYRLYYDYETHVDFVSLYIPIASVITQDDRIYDLIKWFRDEIPKIRNDLRSSVGTGMSRPGVPYNEDKDFRFSGRVFVYTERSFTVIQLGELTSWYRDAGLALQIRGHDYWYANRDR
jgi:hypothetical protein